ncbi:unnamed protein product [Albugo candida]|uniref:Uncharacterized protein n=1 Tax=Albugo candida TaxID=65357 RepID=A0A024GHV6_9STRA|nr:unnamed protein product [Albugo candida]|eukprot:CCI46453.1 unnamed protein product [Albugo candida]
MTKARIDGMKFTAFIVRCGILLLLLISCIIQVLFFTLVPDVHLHIDHCNASIASKTLLSETSEELHVPMRLFYQSLYFTTKTSLKNEKDVVFASKNQPLDTYSMDGIISQEAGQGNDALDSNAMYCINLVAPSNSLGILLDFELYAKYLPSSRPIHLPGNHVSMPRSVIDVFLERHPSDRKYYSNFHYQPEKVIWMMVNVEFFDRHELHYPTVGVILVKNQIGLKKVVEYRQRHRLGFTVFYTKHTSEDLYSPQYNRDWNSFLHLAGSSPFKNTKAILKAWALHPEWPLLVVRVVNTSLCKWIAKHFGTRTTWRLENVDFICGIESKDAKLELQNRIGIHLCPSATEGFGHYINEARSVGALVLTSDVAPMNELVDGQSGILVGRSSKWWWQSKGDLFMPVAIVNIADIEAGVAKILAMSIDERQRMGQQARARFLDDRTFFLNAMQALERSLCQDEVRMDRLRPYLY